ncbi:thiamine-repressible mitochondrial transport protein THI74 isoform X4 [Ricinus communis]|uniref:thiamine-repressible mitochondrial transport protein THI74 isoform X4 n=1 Tax=Ricinus communis TaxID=3988 RepID=UPI00201A3912|nr:thiamine-repressible mitochondrial transport protein THI74 isoform X4 [Ricinus communis]
MENKAWGWIVGLIYIFAVAAIWIAASFVVQSVVDAGVSPFLITYICNSLFVIYIPLVEIGRYLEDHYGSLFFWRKTSSTSPLQELGESEQAILLGETDLGVESMSSTLQRILPVGETSKGVDTKGRWTRARVAKSNTILSTASSLFTFLVSLAFLGEKFTWLKLASVLLCMAGTIIVSLGDSKNGISAVASNPLLGDFFALISAGLYAAYITLIRLKFPDDDGKSGHVSMAQFLGYLGLFNLFLFLPVVLVLNFTMLEPFNMLTRKQFGLIVGKGLLDNVLSDYLWAKAVLLTTTTVATAGLTIQVPLAAIVDTLTGNAPRLMDYLGAIAVMIGFAGINIPADAFIQSNESIVEFENQNIMSAHQDCSSPPQGNAIP